MRASRPNSVVRWLSVLVACTTGCDEPTGPPPTGAIMVLVQAQGTHIPPGGYSASVDGGPTRALDSPNLRITFTDLEPRTHSVQLEGLTANCSVAGQNPLTVTVASNQTAVAQFTVACVANVGTLRVSTVTTGGEQDPDGYMVMVDGLERGPVGLNAAVAIADVRVGLHAVSLGEVFSNCRITTPHPINVNVTFHGTVEVLFNIQCAVLGRLTVTVATTGVHVDPDGYTVHVQAASVGFSERHNVDPDGSVTFTSLLPATDYRVTLESVSANCAIGPDSHNVAVTASGTTSVTFEVSCEAPRLLAIVRDDDIYIIESNGTGATPLTTDPAFDGQPAWSSTGRIAFMTRRHSNDAELYVMNADGTNPVRITTSAGEDDAPSWSPNGARIVFQSSRDVNPEIYVVNADGTGLTRLTNNLAADYQPAWSTTGKIAFVSDRDHSAGEIYVMNDDGSNVVRLTQNSVAESSPAWSPDGSLIAFARAGDCDYYGCEQDLFVMNVDGSNERQLATGDGANLVNADPAWSPNGRAIAFTQMHCPYYCDPAAVLIIDLHGTTPALIANNGADAAWKP